MENQDYRKGFENGIDGVESSHFEKYVSATSEQEWLTTRLGENKLRLARIDEDMNRFRTQQQPLFAKLAKGEADLDHIKREIELENHRKQQLGDEISAFDSQKQERKTSYPLLAGVLYLLAGIAFVAGDLIISHEIVAYALNIRNVFEAWAFAIGLASLSILLKPAYERLVEQPYLAGTGKKVYSFFQSVLLFIAVGTMVVLGWFRYEAYRTDKLKEGINRQIKSMQLESTPIDPSAGGGNTELIQKIDQKLQEYDKLNLDLVNSPWAMLSFILSGVLFAIAGAICLGIAFPILHYYWVRGLQLNPSIRRRKRKIRKTDRTLSELRKEESVLIATCNELRNQTDQLGHWAELTEEKKQLFAENREILELMRQAQAHSRISTFTEGHAKGERNREAMSDEEYEAYRKQALGNLEKEHSSRGTSRSGLRPHQALRKAISESFKEN
jgi:hypothetical protein